MDEEQSVTGSPLRRFREAHEQDVERALRTRGPLTRQELQAATGLSRTTLYAIISRLAEDGAVVESRAAQSGRGRPASVVSLDPNAAQYIGVELGRNHIGVVVANLRHEVVAGEDFAAPYGASAREVGDAALTAIEATLRGGGLTAMRVNSIVIGTPLFFGRGAENEEQVREEIARRVRDRFELTPAFANNARLVALAEMRFGAAADADDLVYIHLDEGVGGGVVLGRQLVNGGHGRAGEIGHITVDPNGVECWCGGVGCLERYVAVPELARRAGVSTEALLRAPDLVELVDGGLRLLACVVAGLLSTLDLRVVVLGGPLGVAPGVARRVRELVDAIVPDHLRGDLDIRVASLGTLGSARGGVVHGLGEGGPGSFIPKS